MRHIADFEETLAKMTLTLVLYNSSIVFWSIYSKHYIGLTNLALTHINADLNIQLGPHIQSHITQHFLVDRSAFFYKSALILSG